MDNVRYDLYLWYFSNTDTSYRIKHISQTDAEKYYKDWLDSNDSHDGMYVLETSTPWINELSKEIIDVTPEWMYQQISEVTEEV